jgi:hypothetical protein
MLYVKPHKDGYVPLDDTRVYDLEGIKSLARWLKCRHISVRGCFGHDGYILKASD